MGFTVNRHNGTKDAEFEAYLRLLRQRGVNLGNLPRVPEPTSHRRWLYVWSEENDAKNFADELKKRTGDPSWEVVPTSALPSEGPMGPLLVQLIRQGDGLLFGLYPLTRAMLQSAYPGAIGVSNVFMDTEKWNDFRATKGRLADLVRQIIPTLTGLTEEQIQNLGYAVIDYDRDETVDFRPPADLAPL